MYLLFVGVAFAYLVHFVEAVCLRLQLKELNHGNIKPFIGACVEPGHICYLMQSCSHGTVEVSLCIMDRALACE